jgi:spore germination protein GerM
MKTKSIVIIVILLALAGGLAAYGVAEKRANPVPEPVATTTPAKPEMTTLRVFFGNRSTDPGSLYCERAYPALREVAKTDAPARAALLELLAGPTEAEKAQGFVTSINQGVTLKSLVIEEGVASADFSARLGEGVGGSCWVSAIRAQITETLKQFPSVENVLISIEGESEYILQP